MKTLLYPFVFLFFLAIFVAALVAELFRIVFTGHKNNDGDSGIGWGEDYE